MWLRCVLQSRLTDELKLCTGLFAQDKQRKVGLQGEKNDLDEFPRIYTNKIDRDVTRKIERCGRMIFHLYFIYLKSISRKDRWASLRYIGFLFTFVYRVLVLHEVRWVRVVFQTHEVLFDGPR